MLTLSRTLATRLLTHAQTSPEQRVCGLLLSQQGAPHSIMPLRNTSAQPEISHAFDPAEYAAALRTAQDAQLEPLAVYHSHPHSPPVPSEADIRARPDAKLSLLVISLNTKGVLELRAFDPQGDAMRETPVQIFL